MGRIKIATKEKIGAILFRSDSDSFSKEDSIDDSHVLRDLYVSKEY